MVEATHSGGLERSDISQTRILAREADLRAERPDVGAEE
jgi:hypothetical protein